MIEDYSGPFLAFQGGLGIDIGEFGQFLGLGGGALGFISETDARSYGISGYLGGGLSVDIIPGIEAGVGLILTYIRLDISPESYVIRRPDNLTIDRGRLFSHIFLGSRSPWPPNISGINFPPISIIRGLALSVANNYANVFEAIHNVR